MTHRRARDVSDSSLPLKVPGAASASSVSSAAGSASSRARFRVGVMVALLGLVVLGVFLPAVRNDFIYYDDNGYVTQNTWIKSGLTWANVRHAFQTTEIAYWHPLTWMSHALDIELFGLKPSGHHLTSVLIHALNSVLVFLVLRKLTAALWCSVVVAALFGLHPLHVESVAWVAERKDVLSTFFWFAALGCYAHWVQQKSTQQRGVVWFYVAAWFSLVLGLMSKPMVVTLPCVLLLLDFWPLARWRQESIGRLVLEKIPFLALSITDCIATVLAQAKLGTVQSAAALPWIIRIENAVVAYFTYLEKCFWPSKLAVFYPYSTSQPTGLLVTATATLVTISIAAVAWRKTKPYLLFGWLWFLGTLVPVIGLVQVGGQSMADRYSYVPLIGVFVMITWSVAAVTQTLRRRTLVVGGVTAAALVLCAGLTTRQLGYWRNSETLFTHAIQVTENNATAHQCLGYFYSVTPDRLAQSITEYRTATTLAPTSVEAQHSLGSVLARKPEGLAEAVEHFQTALRLNPKYTASWYAMAVALEKIPGRLPEAIDAYRAVLRLEPDNADAHNQLGNALAQSPDHLIDAIAEFRETLRLQPDWVETRLNIGGALGQLPGRMPEAIAEYEALLRAKPDFAQAHNNLANALSTIDGRAADAIAEYRAALRLRPDYFEARFNFGQLLAQFPEHRDEAIAQFEAALRLKPDFEPATEMIAHLRSAASP